MMKSKVAQGIAGILIALFLFIGTAKADVYCNPEKSTPCGNGCVRLGAQCSVNWSTSKVGINPNKGKGKRYKSTEIKLVDKAPETTTK